MQTATLALGPVGASIPMASSQTGKNLKTFQQFCRDNQAFTEGGLRWLKFCSVPGRKNSKGELIQANGYADSFVNVGRRVYVDEDRFFQILRTQSELDANAPGLGG